MFVLVSAVQRSEPVLCTHTYPSFLNLPPTPPPGHPRAPSWDPWALMPASRRCYFTRGSAYVSVPLSRLVPPPLSPASQNTLWLNWSEDSNKKQLEFYFQFEIHTRSNLGFHSLSKIQKRERKQSQLWIGTKNPTVQCYQDDTLEVYLLLCNWKRENTQ